MQGFSELLCIDGSGSKNTRTAARKTPIYSFSWKSRVVSRVCTRDRTPLNVFREACAIASPDDKLLIGADLPIGLPVEPCDVYGDESPPIFLKWLEQTSDRVDGNSWRSTLIASGVKERSKSRPFVEVKSEESIGEWAGKRRCDQVSNGSSIYVLGNSAKQVGKSSLQFWLEVMQPLREEFKSKVAVWPFESIESASIVIGECYPRLCQQAMYGSVVSKTDAQSVVSSLYAVKEKVSSELEVEFRTWLHAASSEDEFDMFTTVVSLALSQLSGQDVFACPDASNVLTLEGWMLGLAADEKPVSRKKKRRKSVRQSDAKKIPCPIPGCEHIFYGGRGGWDPHVASLKNHNSWRQDLRTGKERMNAFKEEFPDFFE
ncbi:hypothetical protein Q31b_37660 [Novipirellula aureliae]|uniref:DUF429 domain-containing protein n=1 Tax=Novipirellula aureliae TaxID=2527966 RepID=A0A5C6DPM6_9BACT|nr:hypothetical protein [Novipirellula aureliae]TWU38688.1 hypothetical protein Q31b_37660 [Novipirellula aureliae]